VDHPPDQTGGSLRPPLWGDRRPRGRGGKGKGKEGEGREWKGKGRNGTPRKNPGYGPDCFVWIRYLCFNCVFVVLTVPSCLFHFSACTFASSS